MYRPFSEGLATLTQEDVRWHRVTFIFCLPKISQPCPDILTNTVSEDLVHLLVAVWRDWLSETEFHILFGEFPQLIDKGVRESMTVLVC